MHTLFGSYYPNPVHSLITYVLSYLTVTPATFALSQPIMKTAISRRLAVRLPMISLRAPGTLRSKRFIRYPPVKLPMTPAGVTSNPEKKLWHHFSRYNNVSAAFDQKIC